MYEIICFLITLRILFAVLNFHKLIICQFFYSFLYNISLFLSRSVYFSSPTHTIYVHAHTTYANTHILFHIEQYLIYLYITNMYITVAIINYKKKASETCVSRYLKRKVSFLVHNLGSLNP